MVGENEKKDKSQRVGDNRGRRAVKSKELQKSRVLLGVLGQSGY